MVELTAIVRPDTIGQTIDPSQASDSAVLRDLAQKFETAFLSEMLRHSGLGKMPDGFNGGAGEARFSGFLIESYAEEMSKSGKIGLADRIYQDLVAREAS